jgi:hypothetical protein
MATAMAQLARNPLARLMGAILFLVPALWIVLSVGMANALRSAQPGVALAWAPWDARAKAKVAEHLISTKRDPGALDQALKLSKSSVERDPLSIVGLRNIGLIEAQTGHVLQARKVFTLAGKLSKRDLPVHLWLIEDAVDRNDIDAALLHYDEALRTSPAARGMLLPILVKATDDPAISEPLRRFLARRPPWAQDFFASWATDGPSSTPISALVQSWGAYRERDNWSVVQKLITRLYRERRFQEAHRLFLATVGVSPGRAPLVYNSGFEASPTFAPFDWQLINDEASNTSIDKLEGGGALFSSVQGGRANAATITLLLAPGPYAMESIAKSLEASQAPNARWLIRCEDAIQDELVSVPFQSINLSGDLRASARFRVPARGCRAQTLVLERMAASSGEDPGMAVRSVTIRRVSR